jgi:hypothetical protein
MRIDGGSPGGLALSEQCLLPRPRRKDLGATETYTAILIRVSCHDLRESWLLVLRIQAGEDLLDHDRVLGAGTEFKAKGMTNLWQRD